MYLNRLATNLLTTLDRLIYILYYGTYVLVMILILDKVNFRVTFKLSC